MQDKHTKQPLVRERSIDLSRLALAVLKRAWLLILVAVLCAGMVFVVSKVFMTPKYRSSFTAFVNNRTEGQSTMTSSDVSASRSLTYAYQEIILSRSVLVTAAEQCGLDLTYSQLKSNVTTSVSANAAIINVTVDATDPQDAERLAAAIAQIAPEQVARVVEGSSMRIVDYPVLPTGAFAPNSLRLTVIGFVLALLIGAVIVILMDIVVDKVESAKEMEERYSVAVVGVIPDMAHADKSGYGSYGAYASKHRRK